jgi:hypothetical protein
LNTENTLYGMVLQDFKLLKLSRTISYTQKIAGSIIQSGFTDQYSVDQEQEI